MKIKFLNIKKNFLLFLFLNFTTLFAQENQTVSLDRQLCMLAANGSFNDRLTSITFESDDDELLFYLDSKEAVVVPSEMLHPKAVNIMSIYVETKTLPFDVIERMKNLDLDIFAFYMLKRETSGNYQAMIVSEKHVFFVKHDNTSDSEKLEVELSTSLKNPISIVQGQGNEFYGWVLGKNDLLLKIEVFYLLKLLIKFFKFLEIESENVIMYNLNLGTGNSYQFYCPEPSGTSRYFLSFNDGFMYLHYNKSDSLNNSISFSKPPLGIVQESTGTLFLFDDEKGCVYTVLKFNNPDLEEEFSKHNKQLKFQSWGTSFEKFFDCYETFYSVEELNPERCSFGPIPDEANRFVPRNGSSNVEVIKYLFIITVLKITFLF